MDQGFKQMGGVLKGVPIFEPKLEEFFKAHKDYI